MKVHHRPGGVHTYEVIEVGPDAVLLVPATDPGLREIGSL